MRESCEIVAPVFEEYRTILARYIKSRVKDPIDSEELLSEVMMKIYNHCEKLEGIQNTEAWLITIARNTIHDFLKIVRSSQTQSRLNKFLQRMIMTWLHR